MAVTEIEALPNSFAIAEVVERTGVTAHTCLRLTEMPIRDIQDYFRLLGQGPGTEEGRLAPLVVDCKIANYGGPR